MTAIMLGLGVVCSWTLPTAISVPLFTSVHVDDTAFLPARIISSPAHHYLIQQNSASTTNRILSRTPRRILAAAPSSIREEIRYIAGRRALLLHPSSKSHSNKNKEHQCCCYPPLVILGGMAQSIASWEFHLPYLSKHRSVLIYEALGQGPPPPSEVCSIDGREVTLERYYDNVSLERQGRDFWEVVDEAFFAPGCYYYEQQQHLQKDNGANEFLGEVVDVASFSFGGRVSMAAASIRPGQIRRLHLTGVGAKRDALANVHLASWKEILGGSNASHDIDENILAMDDAEECDPYSHMSRCTSRLRAFAWSVILATYSEQFVASAGPERIKTWVDSVCRYNTEEGLRAILSQTHGLEDAGQNESDQWTPEAMARRIKSSDTSYRIVVGSQDKMANPKQALELARLLSQNNDSNNNDGAFREIEGFGHAVPMEAMRLWREDVLEFLDE